MDRIRNFAIIAHIDHGKSTLADRLLEATGTMKVAREQVLDGMDLEREHGITIKAHPVRMRYHAENGETYLLNLIDTPGHVDFAYEVSRSLAAAEGVVLLIDAAQGVEAQTVAHLHLAKNLGRHILPVINKIDLPHADIPGVTHQVEEILGGDGAAPILVSAKDGIGVKTLLEAIIHEFPSPRGDEQGPLRALIFDSHFDPYRGAVVYVRVVDGKILAGMEIKLMSNDKTYEVSEVGIFSPDLQRQECIAAGGIGYLVAGIKNVRDTKIGDTITLAANPASESLPGYKETKPMVFCGLYPIKATNYQTLKESISKLHLNDSSWAYIPESSSALGAGFRCGFLGLLHMEIIQERLEREYNLELLITNPTVPYRIKKNSGQVMEIGNPLQLPPPQEIEEMEEPFIRGTILLPNDYLGGVLKLCRDRRGIQKSLEYLDGVRVMLIYDLPLFEVVCDFYDKLKSVSRGYASLDYEYIGYRKAQIVRLEVLVAGERVDALASIVPKEKAPSKGRELALRLKDLIPRQQFACPIQVAIGNHIIARETIPALKKHVTGKCYGGDITRKRKLWEKQKQGKKRLKRIGRVDIPQEAFMAILKVD